MNERIALEQSIAQYDASTRGLICAYDSASPSMTHSEKQAVLGRILAGALRVFHITGEDLLHNHKYRELIMAGIYQQTSNRRGVHGVDHGGIPPCEFKSMLLKTKKISMNTAVAMLDKIDRKINDPIYQNSAMMCALIRPAAEQPVIFAFLISPEDLRYLIAKKVPEASEKYLERVNRKGKAHDALTLTLRDFVDLESFRLIRNLEPDSVDDAIYKRLGIRKRVIQ